MLLTDPWLVGSVYWRSWWLQHYPTAEEIDWLATTAHVYVTHEHPDHFHLPSIRRLGAGPAYLFPSLAERGYLGYLSERGFRAEAAPPRRWLALGDGVSILSMPMWNDDSLLMIDTPNALILNLNDAKPLPPVLRAVRRVADRIDKPRVLLCSYSPASVVNSFLDDNGVVALRPARHYVDYACRLCDRLGVDHFMPFASQAVFCRVDSIWANTYSTTYDDLRRYWQSRARLLPPYTTLDLTDFTSTAIAPAAYRPMNRATIKRRTAERAAEEDGAEISPQGSALLERRLNAFRWLLRLLFPRGFGFRFGERSLLYDPRRRPITAQRSGCRAGRFCHRRTEGDDEGGVAQQPPDRSWDYDVRADQAASGGRSAEGLWALRAVPIRRLRPPRRHRPHSLRWLGRGVRCTLVASLPLPPRPR